MSASPYIRNSDVRGDENREQVSEIHGQSQPQLDTHPNQLPARKRVYRACDECRQEKIKCDGKHPCTHCVVYGYTCTYNQPSRRRRNATHQQSGDLEVRLHKANSLLQIALPGLDLDDPRLRNASPEQIVAAYRRTSPEEVVAPKLEASSTQDDISTDEGSDETLMETMMRNFGSLGVDDRGHWDYQGHSSNVIFMQRLRDEYGDSGNPMRSPALSKLMSKPEGPTEHTAKLLYSDQTPSPAPPCDLPPEDVAKRLCRNTLDQACVLMHFVHEPSFWSMFGRVYTMSWGQFNKEEHAFIPQLYAVLAIGCLFTDDIESILGVEGYQGVIEEGFKYFNACRKLVNVTDCRDLTTLQTICFMILFLQSSAKLSSCYSYLGIALRAALRLGLHRAATAPFNPIEQELRKRIFWAIRGLDVNVSILLGMPLMVSEDDIDQEYPLEVDDAYITPAGILPMPPGQISIIAGVNAHSRLVDILVRVVRYLYPVRLDGSQSKPNHKYLVSYSKIRDVEKDLEGWVASLPNGLRPNSKVSHNLNRIRQLLRLKYSYIQWVMYRPFLHYISSSFQSQGIDRRSYVCAVSCVSVARNIVRITTDMYQKGLLHGSFWFSTYSTYFAILTLVFFVLEGPELPRVSDDILEDVYGGKDALDGMSKNSMLTERCTRMKFLLKNLAERVKIRYSTATQSSNLDPSVSTGVSRGQSLSSSSPHASILQPEARSPPTTTPQLGLELEPRNAPVSLTNHITLPLESSKQAAAFQAMPELMCTLLSSSEPNLDDRSFGYEALAPSTHPATQASKDWSEAYRLQHTANGFNGDPVIDDLFGVAGFRNSDMVSLPQQFSWQGFGTSSEDIPGLQTTSHDSTLEWSNAKTYDGSGLHRFDATKAGSDMDIDLDAVFDHMGTTWSAPSNISD